ncbi:Sodium/proline symporter [Polystyrenella longa]|uniref:Sodium/proline symporter n=2 Tax=Polystyrenella longa TaxID=2528007 RepID=A0A518CMZ5_9PLAN|nr:Sodium/proline symporter [Polystyrenella longa]
MDLVIVSFVVSLLGFIIIGVLSTFQRKATTEDYLLADRSVAPWLAALSAVATNNSGFMFIGQIAFAYQYGIQAIWIMVGWIVGDFFAWVYIHPRIREQSATFGATTVPALIASQPGGKTNRPVAAVAGILTFLFLGVYAAAQLKAGSKALEILFEWHPNTGAIMGAIIVVLYCFSGGIRASIWTDAAQSFVMFFAMGILLLAAAQEVGSPTALWDNLKDQDPLLVQWIPDNLLFGFAMYLIGWVFAGFGAIGQPHILVRFMAIRSVEEIRQARTVYFLWFIPFFLGSIAVGMYARGYIPDITALPIAQGLDADYAAELTMPVMAKLLLPDVLVGVVLAGLFAATMSTADSQILVCSGMIGNDINPRWKNSYVITKLATLGVTGLALSIALFDDERVFNLVLIAWSALGAGLGPALVIRLFHLKTSTVVTLLMMLAGVATVIVWHNTPYSGSLFKIVPGMLASFLVWVVAYPFLPSNDDGTTRDSI